MLTNTVDLLKAVKNNDFATVKRLLDDPNININMVNSQGDTPLIAAVGTGNFEMVKLLSEKDGVNLHTASLMYGTALTYAIYKKEWPIANQLLEKEISEFGHFDDEDHPAAFIWAVRNGNIELVKKLHQYGAEINSLDDFESEPPEYIANEIFRSKIATPFQGDPSDPTFNLPLIFAVRNQSYEMISLLIQLGADPKLKGLRDQSAFDALMFLKDSEKAKKIELILKGELKIDNTNQDDTKNFTSSLIFAHNGSDECAVAKEKKPSFAQALFITLEKADPVLLNQLQDNILQDNIEWLGEAKTLIVQQRAHENAY